MPITASDIEFRLSGGVGNSDPNLSLGGVKSTTEIVDATDNNLYDDVSGVEASAGDIEYRGFYVHNDHATLAWQNVVVWIQTETPSGDSVLDIALAGEGVNGTMEVIADESTAPVGEVFTHPVTKAAGLAVGNVPAGEHIGIWVRRTIMAGAAAFNQDGGTIRAEGDTAA